MSSRGRPTCSLCPGGVVATTRNAGSGQLQMQAFEFTPDGSSVAPVGAVVTTDLSIDLVAAVATEANQLFTAVKIQGCSRMQLIIWQYQDSVFEMADSSGVRGDKASSSLISLASLGQGMVTTAVCDSETDRARLAVWCVEDGGRSVTLLGHSGNQVGDISYVNVAVTGSDAAVMVARTTAGRMRLIPFEIDP